METEPNSVLESEMKTVRMGSVILGKGAPKICVPVMGSDMEQIRRAACEACAAGAEIIELRIDSLSAMPAIEEAKAACLAVRESAAGIPLLFTQRTARDGGAGSPDADAYEALLTEMVKSRLCEAIDCELSAGEAAFMRIVKAAHENGVIVVGSSHEFGEIGDIQRAADWLLKQEALGADVCKAAVMTRTGEEALHAAWVMARAGAALKTPMIAIAMGPAGVITRLCGECMGSCLTFGTAGRASAPGQIDAYRLRTALDIVHGALG